VDSREETANEEVVFVETTKYEYRSRGETIMKLKNTLRWMQGEDLITHLGLEYYD
jgi:hypothetical protein